MNNYQRESDSKRATTELSLEQSMTASDQPGIVAGNALSPAVPGIVIFLIFLLATGWPMLRWWYWEYTRMESYYSFALFVPGFVALILWHRRKALASVPKQSSPFALFLVVPTLILLVIAIKTEMQAVMSWTFLLSLMGGFWFVLGRRFVRRAAFPLLFLWVMAPLPGPILNDMTQGIQSLSTSGAATFLSWIGMHPAQIGNEIHLENYTLSVDLPCSGFKLLLTLFTFNSAFAYLTDTTLTRRLCLFLFSVPLSVLINSLRIGMIGIVGECLGANEAHTFHEWSGMISLGLCTVVLFSTAKGLGCRTFAGQHIF